MSHAVIELIGKQYRVSGVFDSLPAAMLAVDRLIAIAPEAFKPDAPELDESTQALVSRVETQDE